MKPTRVDRLKKHKKKRASIGLAQNFSLLKPKTSFLEEASGTFGPIKNPKNLRSLNKNFGQKRRPNTSCGDRQKIVIPYQSILSQNFKRKLPRKPFKELSENVPQNSSFKISKIQAKMNRYKNSQNRRVSTRTERSIVESAQYVEKRARIVESSVKRRYLITRSKEQKKRKAKPLSNLKQEKENVFPPRPLSVHNRSVSRKRKKNRFFIRDLSTNVGNERQRVRRRNMAKRVASESSFEKKESQDEESFVSVGERKEVLKKKGKLLSNLFKGRKRVKRKRKLGHLENWMVDLKKLR
jgi:hypothetical protein